MESYPARIGGPCALSNVHKAAQERLAVRASVHQLLTFPQLLKRFRRGAGLTQEELAERAHLSVEGISALERGINRTARRDTVELLAQALHLGAHDQALFEAAARGRLSHLAPSVPGGAPFVSLASFAPTSRALPLVGRSRELGVLDQHLTVASTSGALLAVVGEPGIGKTRLLQEAAQRAHMQGWTVLSGGCTRRSGQVPHAPLVQVLASYLRPQTRQQLRADLKGCAWLVRLLPELAEDAIALVPATVLPPEYERRLLFAAVKRFLANIAGPAGTLLILDDLHWAGPDALDLLTALLEPRDPLVPALAEAAPPLRVIVAYRSPEVRASDPLGMFVAELAYRGLAHSITLGPLASEAATSLLDGVLGRSGALAPHGAILPSASDYSPAARSRVLERAEGVPFFLISLAQALHLQARDATWAETSADTPDAALATLPWDIMQCIRLRVAVLSVGARALLGLAAVAGRVVERVELLAAAQGSVDVLAEVPDLLAAVEETVTAGLLVDAGEADAFSFSHDLIREVVLADLGRARRAAWHQRLAESLEHLPARQRDQRASELARHFLCAGLASRALPYMLKAGEQAAARFAHEEAESHLRRAVKLAYELGDERREAEALEKLGDVLRIIA